MSNLTAEQHKQLRRLGHELRPVLIIGDKGLSGSVLTEAETQIDHHELIKVSIRVGERELRDQLLERLLQTLKADLIQRVGHIALIYRPNPKDRRIVF